MAGNIPATHTFKGDGVTRVFPISTRIIGDDYVRIEIDGVYIFDRKSWDIVNNSIIFTVAPILNSTVLIKVAESVEAVGLLDNQSTADIIEANIPAINDIYNNLNIINNVSQNTNTYTQVKNAIPNIDTVVGSIENIDIIANSLGDLQLIKNHNNLTNRDEADAHPIEAITGLKEILDGISNDGGSFPTLTATYPTRDTYLSCKVSPTELKAIKLEDLLFGNYNNTPSTSTPYSNIGLNSSIYGNLNTSLAFVKALQKYKYAETFNNIIEVNTSYGKIRHPYNLDVLIVASSSYIQFYLGASGTDAINTTINVGSRVEAMCLTNTGKIVALPIAGTGKIIVGDLVTNIATPIEGSMTTDYAFSDLQLHPNGKVYGCPSASGTIIEIDPETKTYMLYGDLGALNNKYCTALLGTNGNIYCIPRNAKSILEFNPITKAIATYGDFGDTIDKFATGKVGADGNIYFLPNKLVSPSLFMFNPNTKAITEIDLSSKFSDLGKPTSPVAPEIVKTILGVDGVLYCFGVSNNGDNNIMRRGSTDNVFGIDLANNYAKVFGTSYPVSSTAYTPSYNLSDEVIYDKLIIRRSNLGNHYWTTSNYFAKGM